MRFFHITSKYINLGSFYQCYQPINGKNILHLTLTKYWFSLVLEKKKPTEYRERKRHWEKRLLDERGFCKDIHEIHFTNGYGKKRPFIRIKCKDICTVDGSIHQPVNNEPLEINKKYFALGLGEIIKTGNLPCA